MLSSGLTFTLLASGVLAVGEGMEGMLVAFVVSDAAESALATVAAVGVPVGIVTGMTSVSVADSVRVLVVVGDAEGLGEEDDGDDEDGEGVGEGAKRSNSWSRENTIPMRAQRVERAVSQSTTELVGGRMCAWMRKHVLNMAHTCASVR
jgi:hypothetical protein